MFNCFPFKGLTKLLSFFIITSFFSINAQATVADISGTYTGTLTDNLSACTNAGSEPSAANMSISLLSPNSYRADATMTFPKGDADSLTLNITGTTASTFSFTWSAFFINNPSDYKANGTGTGTVTDTGITITANGTETTAGGCTVAISGTLNKTSGTVVVTSATPSSTLTEAVLFNTQIQSTINDISTRVAGAVNSMRTSLRPSFTDNGFSVEGSTGLNAGDGMGMPYGVWGNYSYTNYENDLSTTAFDGSSHGFLGGIDFGVWEGTVMGVAMGYEYSDIDTGFNRGNQDTNSFTVAPYFGAILDDTLSVDFNIGYTRVEYDQYRSVGTTQVTSSPGANRWFGAFNLNAITFVDKWVLGGRVGMLYASSSIDKYMESNGTIVADSKSRLGTASVAGEASYIYGDFEPFLNLAYQYDFQFQKISTAVGPQPSNDRDDILLATGVRYFEKSGISGNLEYSKRLLRQNYDEDRVSLTVRIDY